MDVNAEYVGSVDKYIYTPLDYAPNITNTIVAMKYYRGKTGDWSYSFPSSGYFVCYFFIYSSYDYFREVAINDVPVGLIEEADHDSHQSVLRVRVNAGDVLKFTGRAIYYRQDGRDPFFQTEDNLGHLNFIVYKVTFQ